MPAKRFLNGADYFIYALDRNMREEGLSGNYNVVLFELDRAPEADALRSLTAEIARRIPQLCARLRRSGYRYYWELPHDAPSLPVRVHPLSDDDPDPQLARLLNVPLDRENGELVRFDLFSGPSRHFLCVTIDHVLFDAQSVRQFINLLCSVSSGGDLPKVDESSVAMDDRPRGFFSKLKLIRNSMLLLDGFAAKAVPHSFAFYRQQEPSKAAFGVKTITFTEEETARAKKNAATKCGFLNETSFYTLAAIKSMDRLYRDAGYEPGSFVFPLIMHLAKNDYSALRFGNNITFMYYQLLPEELAAGDAAVVASLKRQMTEQVRSEIHLGAWYGLQFLRLMPIDWYRRKMYQSMKGEIGSLFLSNIGAFTPSPNTLLGARVRNISYYPSVCTAPGIAVTFSTHGKNLSCTVVWVDKVFTAPEIENLCSGIHDEAVKG